MATDNPFEALRVLVERMTEILAETAPGLTIADTKFDPARQDGPYPHPDLMHVTFLLDPAVAFAPVQVEGAPPTEGYDAPVDEAQKARDAAELARMEVMMEKDVKDEKVSKETAPDKRRARKEELEKMRDDLRNPDGGFLDD